MLKNRIITALILAPLALAGVILLPAHWFALLFGAAAALGGYEWAGLSNLTRTPARLGFMAVFAGLAVLVYGQPQLYAWVLYVACAVWALAAVAVLTFPRGAELFKQTWLMAPLGLLLLLAAWCALNVIRAQPQGPYWLIWALVLVWGADIGAYFAGRQFGRRKLAPAVSPGKTWEGALGGLLLAGGLCALGLLWLAAPMWPWLLIMLALVGVSVFGDLFESVLKRATGVKDSGSLLPGHGGVLDRIDSLLAVLPVFAVLLLVNR